MADATQGGIPIQGMPPHLGARAPGNFVMIDILAFYQLTRIPMQAFARRWWCVSLFRASHGRRRCAECTGS